MGPGLGLLALRRRLCWLGATAPGNRSSLRKPAADRPFGRRIRHWPGYYNFVDVRYIGEPVLRSRIVDVSQNVTYINQTVNVTNITYENKTVYNYGPDLDTVNQYSSRPIQKLKLERQANVDVTAAAKSGGLTKVQGNALVV